MSAECKSAITGACRVTCEKGGCGCIDLIFFCRCWCEDDKKLEVKLAEFGKERISSPATKICITGHNVRLSSIATALNYAIPSYKLALPASLANKVIFKINIRNKSITDTVKKLKLISLKKLK
ncbi:hypothetical protein HZB05_02575 [Candidatus Wolfebacteria bacterium]|nr:hypothetical protein [Candidatus Wolfebacteria bacterium]